MSLPTTDFAPANPTDGRRLLEWQTKYTDPVARRWIRIEATYLAILFFATPIIILILWLEGPQKWLQLPGHKYRTFFLYGLAWIGGTFGGTLFGIKWLYHSVAKQIWHEDRRLWRLFTPHISGGFAFIVLALISSGLVKVFDPRAIESSPLILGVAFLVGYFSDSTAAKLAEIAATIFGTAKSTENKNNSPDSSK